MTRHNFLLPIRPPIITTVSHRFLLFPLFTDSIVSSMTYHGMQHVVFAHKHETSRLSSLRWIAVPKKLIVLAQCIYFTNNNMSLFMSKKGSREYDNLFPIM